MDLGLGDRAAIVTGASSGIGRALSRLLAAEGARVLMVARGEDRLADAAEEIGADWLAIDVTDPAAGERIVACAAEQLGRVDVLVNNAGISFVRSIDELTDADWQDMFDLHVMASMRLMRAAAPRMAEAGWGRIVNVGSSGGKRPSTHNLAYGVTKAAQASLSRGFADLYASRGVLVNTVSPGPVASEMWMREGGQADQEAAAKGMTREAVLQAKAEGIPLGRFAEPQEIAAVCLLLCSEAASTVTGANWSADGGTFASII